MNILNENKIKLSHGALKYIYEYEIKENKTSLNVNFILQIFKCVRLLNTDLYSCTIFDDECISNNFILKYNMFDKRPYEGDIILIKKININILSDGEHVIYLCREISLLEKRAKFLIDFKNLINIPTKINKLNQKNQFNNKFILSKNNNNIIKVLLTKREPYKISHILKTIILISISQQKIYNINNNQKKFKRVFLINKNILELYKNEYEQINFFIKNDEKIKCEIEQIKNSLKNNLENIENIISKFDINVLMKIDEKIKKKNYKISFESNCEIVKLINKKIKIYKEFILVNKIVYDYIQNNFDDSIYPNNIYYLFNENRDIISIVSNPQYSILIDFLLKIKIMIIIYII